MKTEVSEKMTSQDALTIAVSLTDEILVVLDNQNLDRLSELEAKREPLIRHAFEQSVHHIDEIKAAYLQKLNHQVIEKLLKMKQSTKYQIKNINHGTKAAQAYQGNQF